MAKQEFTKTLRQTMTAGFLKVLIEKLANEENPFDMKVRRIDRGVWEVDVLTTDQSYDYFCKLTGDLLNGKSV